MCGGCRSDAAILVLHTTSLAPKDLNVNTHEGSFGIVQAAVAAFGAAGSAAVFAASTTAIEPSRSPHLCLTEWPARRQSRSG